MKKGFTLIEVIIAMAIFSLLFYLASVSYYRMQKARLLDDQLWQIASILRQQQNKSTSGEVVENSQLRFGVLFADDYYQEFATLSDFNNREESYDLINDLPAKFAFVTFNLPDTCLQANDCIFFSSIEGTPSAIGTIVLENQKDGESQAISINEQGKVSF
jgi:prepilin-type N-terminal cleavage/methylation domain-containing protein